jgi:8-oxo-dGTP pyrophosphatase MutT (NUDIX family)
LELNRTMTATVYVLKDDKVLLHYHKKYNTLFPLGGHIQPNELPDEAAVREVYEESGLKVSLLHNDEKIELGNVKQIHNPMYLLLENIGQTVENIDFIYFATTEEDVLKPQEGESTQFYWLSREEIINNKNIKQHIKEIALKALDSIK